MELALLAAAGLVAGYVNAVAGAGSLLTLPALIFTGLDPAAANATNRVAVLFQNAAALVALRRGRMRLGKGPWLLALPAGAGAAAGAWVATLLSRASLELAIALAMVVFLLLSLVPRRRRGAAEGPGGDAPEGASPEPREATRARWSMVPAFVAIGFYAGFLQAGVGVLLLLYLSLVHGERLVAANALKIAAILVLAAVALVVFYAVGATIDPLRGLLLAATTSAGAYAGARDTLRRGERFVKAALVVAVLLSAAKLAWDALG